MAMTEINLPASSQIKCPDIQIGENVEIGPDVYIECEQLRLGSGVRIGCQADADFRTAAGVQIRVRTLELDDRVIMGRSVRIQGGHIHLGPEVRIKDWNDINVKHHLSIGANGTVHEHCEISGLEVQLGRELWMLSYAKIGGGSAFEVQSSLEAGHFLHIGMYSLINTARAIIIGDEVGLGTRTALYTHGAYPSELWGAPVAFGEIYIGDRSWLPGATVNPGVRIGRDCIIGVGSVVTRDIPDGALAAGAPCKVIREHAYPRELSVAERQKKMGDFLQDFATICSDRNKVHFNEADLEVILDDTILVVYRESLDLSVVTNLRRRGAPRLMILTYTDFPCPPEQQETFINLQSRHIEGLACSVSERLLNQIRRHGTRFRYRPVDSQYQNWDIG